MAVCMCDNKAELGEGEEGERETGRGHGVWSEGRGATETGVSW